MDLEANSKLKTLIRERLIEMWDHDENNILGEFYFGENTLYLMAEAAANTLIATKDVTEYLRDQKVKL